MTNKKPKDQQQTQVQIYNAEISRELSDPGTMRALMTTTFKGLDEKRVRQAALEAMIRGFKLKDFLSKNVYAVPFGSGYTLMTSIEYARKLGMRGGINGKSAPKFEMSADGKKILACTVTVYKKDGHPEGYSATVYFDEYVSDKGVWKTKPRTMIAKVAEMHALRMACPEETAQLYVEEEMQQERERITIDATEVTDDAPTIRKMTKDPHEKDSKKAEDAEGTIPFDVADNHSGEEA